MHASSPSVDHFRQCTHLVSVQLIGFIETSELLQTTELEMYQDHSPNLKMTFMGLFNEQQGGKGQSTHKS